MAVFSANPFQIGRNLRIPIFATNCLPGCHGQENGISVSKLENCLVIVVILLTKQRIFFAALTVMGMLAFVACGRLKKHATAASIPGLLIFSGKPLRSGP